MTLESIPGVSLGRDNLEWLARATNWAKFTATASLGVIHKVRPNLLLLGM